MVVTANYFNEVVLVMETCTAIVVEDWHGLPDGGCQIANKNASALGDLNFVIYQRLSDTMAAEKFAV